MYTPTLRFIGSAPALALWEASHFGAVATLSSLRFARAPFLAGPQRALGCWALQPESPFVPAEAESLRLAEFARTVAHRNPRMAGSFDLLALATAHSLRFWPEWLGLDAGCSARARRVFAQENSLVLSTSASRTRKTARAREKRLALKKNGPRTRKRARAQQKRLVLNKKGSCTRILARALHEWLAHEMTARLALRSASGRCSRPSWTVVARRRVDRHPDER